MKEKSDLDPGEEKDLSEPNKLPVNEDKSKTPTKSNVKRNRRSEEIHEKRRLEKVVVEDRTQSSSFSLQSVIKHSVIKHSFKCFHKDKGKLFNMKTKGQQARIERIFLHKYFTTDKR